MKHSRVPALLLFGAFWLTCVIFGGFILNRYAQSAGDKEAAPTQWPSSVKIPRELGVGTLMVFLHPDCSCSRATLDELSEILVFAPKRLKTYAIFIRPEGWSDQQLRGDLWKRASSITGVATVEDVHADAKVFGAKTSGHTVLYDLNGRLLFHGGITASRGHRGDNLGQSLVVNALRGLTLATHHTEVYGCGIFSNPSLNKISRWASRLTNWGS